MINITNVNLICNIGLEKNKSRAGIDGAETVKEENVPMVTHLLKHVKTLSGVF